MIYLVTGFAGSGTSRIAEHLHRAGVPMAIALRPPKSGTDLYQSWTDMSYLEMFKTEIDMDPTMAENQLAKRRAICEYKLFRAANHSNHWGLKSPLLLLNLPMWLDELRAMGEVRLVLTDRPFDECQASIRRHGNNPLLYEARDRGLRLNQRFQQARALMAKRADVVVKFGAPLTDVLE